MAGATPFLDFPTHPLRHVVLVWLRALLRDAGDSDPGCPQLKNYYSPIWIAMRWYKARAFMRHHKTSEPRQRRLPIKHKGLIPFSSKLKARHSTPPLILLHFSAKDACIDKSCVC